MESMLIILSILKNDIAQRIDLQINLDRTLQNLIPIFLEMEDKEKLVTMDFRQISFSSDDLVK